MRIARLAVALVWLYQGLWCKLLGGCPGHRAIVEAMPWLGPGGGAILLAGLGLLETGLAAWVLSGWRLRAAALVQTILLVAMNGGGLLWGREHIADPGAMLTQNFAFLTLAWIVAGTGRRQGTEETESPWQSGRLDGRAGPPQLLFGRMHEDWRVEAEAFRPGGRIFCIASSGCTALALAARGFRVTAADINPVQVEYARARFAGAPVRQGVAERWMARLCRALPLLGMREPDLRAFLQLSDPAEQVRVWRERLDTWRFRAALRCALHPAALRLPHGARFVDSLPPHFDRIVRGRFERAWANHPNRDNPYAWRLLLGEEPPSAEPPGMLAEEIELVCADAAEYLESCPPATFDGFSLSNMLDAVPPVYRERLLAAVRRAAAPEAVLVLRSFWEPGDQAAAEWAARDRSLLWGAIHVVDVAKDIGSAAR
ncbi:MAG TPA: DoxX-like family protein [Thermoanaerobaculia bacterium]|nr:DoxX-like family protein [Thermoanaerobaculia bacterium]